MYNNGVATATAFSEATLENGGWSLFKAPLRELGVAGLAVALFFLNA